MSFTTRIVWTGDRGAGTAEYRGYDRTWDVVVPGRPPIHCSNDPALGGDPNRANPEELLLAALSACHMLWYLHFASTRGVIVRGYRDSPRGDAEMAASGAGRFLSATLMPHIRLAAGTDVGVADAIHAEIGAVCFIARSVSFPVHHEPTYELAD